MSDATARIRQALHAIATVWPDMLPDAPRPQLTGTIGRTQSQPLPIPVHTLDVRAQALGRLAGWCQVVIEDQDLHPRLDGQDVPGMARFLAVHADFLAQHEAVDVVLEELEDSKRRAVGIVDRPGPLEFVGRCEVCQGDLRARQGEAAVCRECKAMVDAQTTRDQLTREAEDRLMTAAEIVRLAPRMWDEPVSHVRVSRWVKAGQLVGHGWVQDGGRRMALHRVGDVAKLVARQGRRAG